MAALGQDAASIICLQSLQLSAVFYFALCQVKTTQVFRNKGKAKNESITNVNRNKKSKEKWKLLVLVLLLCIPILFTIAD